MLDVDLVFCMGQIGVRVLGRQRRRFPRVAEMAVVGGEGEERRRRKEVLGVEMVGLGGGGGDIRVWCQD